MTTFAYRDDGRVVMIEDDIRTTLPSEEGDTPAHQRLAEFLDAGGEIADAPPPAPPLTPEELVAFKADRRREIDLAAEAERLKYITGGAGQAMTYSRKLEEARAAAAEEEPDAQNYPLLAASVGIDGATVAAVAQVVLGMDAAWTVIGAAIETVRLAAKKAIDDAEDEAAVRAVEPVWPQS